MGVRETRETIRSGAASVVELLKHRLAWIRQHEPRIQAWSAIDEAAALEQAKKLDAIEPETAASLPLLGVPVGIKDVIDVAGFSTRAGSKFLNGPAADRDATCVARLRKAGAIILGKTATTEFAFYDAAPTRNPHNLDHTPGGSSSGSAAAVSAGFCCGALGTQTFGSVIRPAAYCGIVGFKPTYDVISRTGVLPLAWSLDHVGTFARSVGDTLAISQALINRQLQLLPSKTVGVPDRFFFENTDSAVLAGFEAGVAAFEKSGYSVLPVQLPSLFETAVSAAGVMLRVEAATFHQRWFAEHASDYGPKLRAVIEAGKQIAGVDYLRARQVKQKASLQMRQLLEGVDVLLTPATPSVAPEGISWTGDPVFNTPFSAFGCPALTLPARMSPSGMPCGVQLISRPRSDGMLLQAAWHLEESGFGHVVPPRF